MKRIQALSVLLGVVLGGSLAIGAQTAAPEGPQQSRPAASGHRASKSDRSTFLAPRTAKSDNLAAAEAEDDKSVYRHSASVRAVGGWLHLDPEASARLFEYLNFGILVAAALFFMIKYLPGMLRAHREAIQKQLMEARTATEQANVRLKAIEQKFARLDQEIGGIRAQAEKEGMAEEARIKALIETERKRIIRSAEQEIAAAAAAAQRQLKRFAAGLAVDRAAQMISLDEEGDRNLVRQFTQSPGVRNGEPN